MTKEDLIKELDSYDDNDFLDIFWGNKDFKKVTEEKVVVQGRWETVYKQVLEHVPTNIYFYLYWHAGNTEYQECEPGFTYKIVQPVEKTVVVYEEI